MCPDAVQNSYTIPPYKGSEEGFSKSFSWAAYSTGRNFGISLEGGRGPRACSHLDCYTRDPSAV